MLTQQELKIKLHYDPETGIFTRLFNSQKYKHGSKVETKTRIGYISTTINYKNLLCHRLAWLYVYGEFPK